MLALIVRRSDEHAESTINVFCWLIELGFADNLIYIKRVAELVFLSCDGLYCVHCLSRLGCAALRSDGFLINLNQGRYCYELGNSTMAAYEAGNSAMAALVKPMIWLPSP